jgi:hypothetical protein
MALTGKSEIMAGVFVVASNDFMTEFHDLEKEQDHGEDEVVACNKGQGTSDLVDGRPVREKQGNCCGKK